MKMQELKTPVYLIDEAALEKNLRCLQEVSDRSGAKILLAQKAFSAFYEYPRIARFLSGCTSSGLYESKLCSEEMPGRENHVFCPAYTSAEMDELVEIADHIIFNSTRQFDMHYPRIKDFNKRLASESAANDRDVNLADTDLSVKNNVRNIQVGLRINPELSTQEGHAIYDPCAPGSRLGITRDALDKAIAAGFDMTRVNGIHFHTLCEQNSDALEKTCDAVIDKFGDILESDNVKWLNMGGGHHITREDYDIDLLCKCVERMQKAYNLQVYLEPGEAIALNAGYLVTTVLDIVENAGIKVLILDTSAACHMPDVLEMPYRPPLRNSGQPGEKKYTYRLSSCTCLSGDVIGDYSFDKEINIGDRLVFEDMAIYSMVKNNTFNGMPLPDIAVMDSESECTVIRSFTYEDFKCRLS